MKIFISATQSIVLTKKRKHTKRFESHRLKIKLQNKSNLHFIKLCFFYYLLTQVLRDWHNLKSKYIKRYIKSLTGETINLHLWKPNLKIRKSTFTLIWNAPLENKSTGQWRRLVPLKCCPDCANIVKLNSKHFSNLK